MEKLAKASVLFIALSITQTVLKQPGSDEITVRLSLDKQRYELGEQIQVEVRVKNQSDQPLIVANLISQVDNREGYVEFSVTDTAGRCQAPQFRWVGDTFARAPQMPDWRAVLGRWLVLRPKDSIASYSELDGETFPFLTKPGKYKLSATYSSAGLSYGLNYGRLGLTAQDVASLKIRPWSGKVRSNSVWITIVPAQAQRKKQPR